MKKIKLSDKKLSLNKQTVARLNDNQMSSVQGGEDLKPRTSKGRTCGDTMCDCPQSKISVCTICPEL